jgi:hypothetical protein
MSMDYPDYLRIREKSRFLGWLWRIGDLGYYLGIVATVLAFSGIVAILAVAGGVGWIWPAPELARYWAMLPLCLIALPVGVVVFVVSACLKEIAHRYSGIHDEDGKAP